MNTKYGSYSSDQIHLVKLSIRKSIFFLLLYLDPKTKDEYKDIDITEAFRSLQYKLNGLNSILLQPPELVETMSLIEAALIESQSKDYQWHTYRKLILDAGAKIMQVKEGDSDGDHI